MMTRDEFIYHVLAACPCEIRVDKEWFEREELIQCADDLCFKNPEYQSEDCISRAEAIEALEYNISIESDEGLDAYKTVIKEILCKIYDVQKENIEKLSSIKPKTDVLEKIRAEIKEVQTYKMFEGEDTVYVERKDVLAIIDKCKAEKE